MSITFWSFKKSKHISLFSFDESFFFFFYTNALMFFVFRRSDRRPFRSKDIWYVGRRYQNLKMKSAAKVDRHNIWCVLFSVHISRCDGAAEVSTAASWRNSCLCGLLWWCGNKVRVCEKLCFPLLLYYISAKPSCFSVTVSLSLLEF